MLFRWPKAVFRKDEISTGVLFELERVFGFWGRSSVDHVDNWWGTTTHVYINLLPGLLLAVLHPKPKLNNHAHTISQPVCFF